ncbi:MAG TPA: BTAD domain-containing putative transcriptional regulator [Acidimicrobiia bacterium]|nr:BTAD domain-containing putative transcriptional regulator [Acidimicrobiia bacterium]
MLIRILGRVGVSTDDDDLIAVRAPKQRALLVRLVLDANQVVGSSTLIESLWDDDLPQHPRTALQIIVSRLKTNLGPYGTHITAVSGGYRLDAAAHEVDLLLAESLLRDGRMALASEESARAADAFERALALWTGDAFEDVESCPFWPEAVRRAADLRLTLVEARNDAYLASGRHLEVLRDIDALVAAAPLREHLRAQQIAALYRAGRQAEAMRASEALRKSLRDELGLEPSPQIRDLERRVLDQDPSLVATDAGFMTPLPAWTAETVAYVGRGAEYEHLLTRLAEAVEGEMRFLLVEGVPGIGKSRFLSQVARRLSSDAIVLPVHVHDVFSPALRTFARVIAEATLGLSDDELATVIGIVPEATRDLPQLRELTRALVAGEPVPGLDDEEILEAAARWIAGLSAKAPVVVVVDDLDHASPALLHVFAQIANLSMPKRVLVVGSVRTPFDTTAPYLAHLVATLEASACIDRIVLPPLDATDIDELLERMRIAPREKLGRRLLELTAGSPLMVAELLSTGPLERVVADWTSPPRVRDLARRRTAELGRATAELLKHASLFERDFTIDLLAETAGIGTRTATELVDRAVEAHILQSSTMRSYRFAHQLFRHAIAGDLSATQRADGHRRIAEALERRNESPALLAAHWSAASGDIAEKVFAYARLAGRESLKILEPQEAASWFQLALVYLTDEADRGSLLAELAEAQMFAGDAACIASLQAAVDLALTSDDDDLVVQIVRVTTPGWSTLPGVTGPETRQLIERALDVVDDPATRSRVLARLAVDMSLSDAPAAERGAAEAVALARASGDRTALLETLSRSAALSLTPETLEARRNALREVLDLSSSATDVVTRYFALSSNIVPALQSGDLAEADALSAEADTIAAHYELAPLRWSTLIRRAWRAGLDGSFDVAEELIEEASSYGEGHGVSHAPEAGWMQRGWSRWQQGRICELLPVARSFYDNVGRQFPGFALLLARILAEDPECHDEARQLLRDTAANHFGVLPGGTFWSSTLVLTAETACMLGERAVCETIRDLLVPFADQVVFNGLWVVAPVAYGVGIAAAGCGDAHAPRHLDRAVAIATRLRAPALVARARAPRLTAAG